jgi:hypothetical protein
MSALINLAQQANEIQQQYQSGQITPAEFKELCEDLKVVGQIADDAADFEMDQQYRAFILGVLQVAAAVY